MNKQCPKAIYPETIERIARAMCEADGNDPDRKCMRFMPPHLNGLASRALQMPNEGIVSPAWMLYGHLAEAAIGALEKTQTTKWLHDNFPERMASEREPIVIMSRIHDQDEPGTIVMDDLSEMKQLEIPMSYVSIREYENLAADILNDPFKQETNRILARVESESQAHALQTAELVKQPVDFLALNKASST